MPPVTPLVVLGNIGQIPLIEMTLSAVTAQWASMLMCAMNHIAILGNGMEYVPQELIKMRLTKCAILGL